MPETICAVSTPPGRAGIGVVRISGTQLQVITEAVLGRIPEPRVATLATFKDGLGRSIDTGLAIYFAAPHSFTGEDVLEFQGHANPILHDLIIERLEELGVRLAHPGEFTERAFLNDRMDLTQAEAVMDLIASTSRQASRAALRSLQGRFSHQVLAIDQQILELRVYVESAFDFTDEEIDILSDKETEHRLCELIGNLEVLIEKCEQGRQMQQGYNLVIAGPPNVGKSSLFNALLNEDRAIVTEVAGTTRDTLDATIYLEGLPIMLIDTAGLHTTVDPVELAGIRRTENAMSTSDLIVWVLDDRFDDSKNPIEGDFLRVQNKCDLSKGSIGQRADGSIGISALTGSGLTELRDAIQEMCGFQPSEDAFAGRSRHIRSMLAAKDRLNSALDLLVGRQGDLVAENLRLAHSSLGEVVGTTTTDDLLAEIFSKFCIGK